MMFLFKKKKHPFRSGICPKTIAMSRVLHGDQSVGVWVQHVEQVLKEDQLRGILRMESPILRCLGKFLSPMNTNQ